MVQARPRPLFEPTDLELEEAGIAELDMQFGAVRGQGPWRVVIPDFELDVGLLPNLEVDFDGAYAIEGPQTGPFALDHATTDSLWTSLKWGLYDDHDEVTGRAWAVGLQTGPKLPIASGSHGLGFETLALVGRSVRRLHTVLNLGGFIDPSPDAIGGRPVGVELGLDLGVDLGNRDRFSLTGEISGVRFVSSDPNQLLATAGVTWSITKTFDVSISGMIGLLSGNDRYGALLGLSPKMRLFGR